MNISNNINAIHSAQNTLNTIATDVAKNPKADLVKDMTGLISVDASTKANVNTIKTQDEMFGSLLDIKA